MAVLGKLLEQEVGAQDLAKTRQMLAAVQENARNAGVDLSDAAT